MDPVTIVVSLGFIGGAVIALLLALANRRFDRSDPFAAERESTDMINMAHIRVAGIGGLGLVAVAAVVAITIPRIGQSLGLGLALGAIFAVALVLWRRRVGPMPSSGRQPGANTTLSIDAPPSPKSDKPEELFLTASPSSAK